MTTQEPHEESTASRLARPVVTRLKRAFSPWVWLFGFLPGGLFGATLGGLLFFLNPDLDFSPPNVAQALLFFTLLAGAFTTVGHALFAGLFRWRSHRWLPWSLTFVLSSGAVMAWVHASLYSFYLTPGLDNRLIKAAISLTAIALVAFYTTLLHALHARPWSGRSQFLLFALCVLSIFVLLERRSAWKPTALRQARPLVGTTSNSPRLLVVGIESASLDVILPLTGQGKLPFFADILRRGAYGRLGSLSPVRRSPIWYSLSSGQYPYKHGVVSEDGLKAFARDEERYNLRPIAIGIDRWGPMIGLDPRDQPPPPKSPALWDFLQRFGVRTALVGWPAPDESLAGCEIALSDSFLQRPATGSEIPPGIPPGLLTARITGDDIDPALLARFGEPSEEWLRDALAQDLWRESIAYRLLETGSADALFLGLPGLLTVSEQTFAGYNSSQFEGRKDDRAALAAQRLTAYYSYLDTILARLWQRIEGPKLLVVTSAWGTDEPGTWDWLTALAEGGRPLGARFDTAPDGVFMMLGDNLASGTFLENADVLDVAPTVLYALGVPLAPELDGRVQTESFGDAFLDRTPLTFVPSFVPVN